MPSKKRPVQNVWQSYRQLAIPQDASEAQLREIRQAFFAGIALIKQVLFSGLSDGDGVTQADLEFMQDLQDELDEFGQEIDARYLPMLLQGMKKH